MSFAEYSNCSTNFVNRQLWMAPDAVASVGTEHCAVVLAVLVRSSAQVLAAVADLSVRLLDS